MAKSRSYKRNRKGQFASKGTAVMTTTGRAGGFANAAHRSAVQGKKVSRAAAARRRQRIFKIAGATGGAVGYLAMSHALSRGRIKQPANIRLVQEARSTINYINRNAM